METNYYPIVMKDPMNFIKKLVNDLGNTMKNETVYFVGQDRNVSIKRIPINYNYLDSITVVALCSHIKCRPNVGFTYNKTIKKLQDNITSSHEQLNKYHSPLNPNNTAAIRHDEDYDGIEEYERHVLTSAH